MDTADAAAREGFQRFTRGDLDGALEALQRALELDPDHRDALRTGAMAALRIGQAERALGFAERLAQLEPDDVMAWSSLSLIRMRAGRSKEEAEEAAAKARLLTWKRQLKEGPAKPGSLEVLDTAPPPPSSTPPMSIQLPKKPDPNC